jgi:AAA+ ATPase superfamily predicted ATPase
MSGQYTPTLVIGLGGTGYRVLSLLKASLLEENDGEMPNDVKLLAFDTQSPEYLRTSKQNISRIFPKSIDVELGSDEFVSLEGDLMDYVLQTDREKQQNLINWANTQELLHILPRASFILDGGASRNRRMARLALFSDLNRSNHGKILSTLLDSMQRIRYNNPNFYEQAQICVVSSLAGGTGSSWLIDFPIILHQLSQRMGTNLLVRAFFTFPPTYVARNLQELDVNTFSTLRELDRLMSAKPEQPVIIEYPKSERFLGNVTLQRPVYDNCYLFGEKGEYSKNENALYSAVSDVLLAFTDNNFFSAYNARESNKTKNLSYFGKGEKNYTAIGVYSFNTSLYWLKKHLAAQHLKGKISDYFRFTTSDGANSGWPLSPTISIEEGFRRFLHHSKTDNETYAQSIYILDSLCNLANSENHDNNYFKTQIEAFRASLSSVGKEPGVQRLRQISTYDYKHFLDYRNLGFNIWTLDMQYYTRFLEKNLRVRQMEFFGSSRFEGDIPQGSFQSLLSENNKDFCVLFIDLLSRYGNWVFESGTDFDEGVGRFGYFLWLLRGMQRIFRNALMNLEKSITDLHKGKFFDLFGQQKSIAIERLLQISKQGLWGRVRVSGTIRNYGDVLERERQYLFDYYTQQQAMRTLQMMIDLTDNLIRQLDEAADILLRGEDSLLTEIEKIAHLYLYKHQERSRQYQGVRVELSSPDNFSELLPLMKKELVGFPLKISLSKSRNETINFEVNFLESKNVISHFKERNRYPMSLLLSAMEKWSTNIVDETVDLNKLDESLAQKKDISALLLENSAPWMSPSDYITEEEKNASYYLILEQSSQFNKIQARDAVRRQLENIKSATNEVFTSNVSGMTFLQISNSMSINEIKGFSQYQEKYYAAAGPEYNPANHILPAEISAFRYENHIADKYHSRAKPLSKKIVQLLQNEKLLELCILAFAHEFIVLNRDVRGYVWYQLSHPKLRSEIYLTDPEQMLKDPGYMILEAFSTFILKGYDARSRYFETKINYLDIEGLLRESSRELYSGVETNDETKFLSEFYEKIQKSTRTDSYSPQKNTEFEDLLAVINMVIDRWKGIFYRARAVAPKPIFKVSDHYVVAVPLKSESKNLFVGRQKYFEQIENIWKNQTQKASIILYGQRRMGKTSLLYQLESRLGGSYITVLLDFQGIGPQIRNEKDFWRLLAKQIRRGLDERQIVLQTDVDVAEIKSSEKFDDYLYAIEKNLGIDKWLVLLIDEFEKIEEKIDAGIVSTDVFDSLRHIIQHRDKIIILLAGHHTLQERLKQYWNPLMETAINVKLTYLSKEEARLLIQSPWSGFELKYNAKALERIIEVCGGQPLLIQLVCKGVINRVNQRLQETGGSVSPTATQSDIEFVLQRIVVAEDRDADTITFFFDAVWSWLKEDEKEYLKKLAKIAAGDKGGWIKASNAADIISNTEILNRLVDRDVLEKSDGGYRFRVDLLKQWVVHKYGK